MRFSRARYVTLCQQSLVTAAVLAVGVSAAGVKTLDIVPQPGQTADLGAGVPGAQPRQALAADAEPPAKTQVDAAPVTPKVREVKVAGISAKAPKAATPRARQAPRRRTSTTGPPPRGAGEPKRVVALSEPEPVRGYATVGVTWKHGTDVLRRPDRRDGPHRGERHVVALDARGLPRRARSRRRLRGGGRRGASDPGTDALVVGRRRPRADACGDHRRQHPSRPQARRDRPGHRRDDQGGSGDRHREAGVAEARPRARRVARRRSRVRTPALGARLRRAGHGRAQRHEDRAAPQDLLALPVGRQRAAARAGRPDYGTVKAGFIHHTVNSNSYSPSQVPSLLRGIYAYHTQSRGWRDIGYNFLVDRFGRIWEGRYGGVTRAVVGAHTLGYNEYSFALSAIGNFDVKSPPERRTQRLRAALRLEALDLQHPCGQPPGLREEPLLPRDQRSPRRRADRLPGPVPLRASCPRSVSAAQSIQNNAQSDAPTPATAKPAATPFTSPTQTPLAAKTAAADHDVPADEEPERSVVPRPGARRTPRAG